MSTLPKPIKYEPISLDFVDACMTMAGLECFASFLRLQHGKGHLYEPVMRLASILRKKVTDASQGGIDRESILKALDELQASYKVPA